MNKNLKSIATLLGCTALLAGCTQNQPGRYNTAPAATAPATAGTVTAYFPSGKMEGSGLEVDKSAPAQVLAGQPYSYTYKVSNLTDETLENVTINDRVTSDFTPGDSDPKATSMSGGTASWSLGTLGPKESKTITVNGTSADEGVVTTCGSATYNPVVCQDIHVVKPNISLTKTEPSDVLICDPIPTTLVVSNTGTSPLTQVQITDTLPAGLTSDGKSSLTFTAPSLAPGASQQFTYNAAASTTGKLVNDAKVTTAENVSAEAQATVNVHQPVLAVTCKATDQQYMGRKISVSYTVSNTGDSPAAGSVLTVAVPAGLDVADAGSGTAANGAITYNLGTVDTTTPQTVNVTFISTNAGSFDFAGTVKGTCAAAASTTCSTKVVGVAAILLEKADDPDPVAIGDTTTYTVKVTNQGSADDHNVQVIVTVDSELVPTSTSEGTIDGQTVTLPTVPALAPKAAVTYKIVCKGVTAGDAHTVFKLSSDVLSSPITAEESTHVY